MVLVIYIPKILQVLASKYSWDPPRNKGAKFFNLRKNSTLMTPLDKNQGKSEIKTNLNSCIPFAP